MRTVLSRRSLLAALAATGLSCQRRAQAGRGRPLVIVFGPQHAPRNAEALRQGLAARSRLLLELRAAKSASEAVDLVQAGQADAGLLPLFDFLFCADVYGVQPLVQVLRLNEQAVHSGELVVRADSTVRELAELRGRRVGYVDQYSVTGFLLPAATLREAKVEIEPVWVGGHDAVLEAVASGKVVAAATYSGHETSMPGLRILASTGAIANEPLFVQSSVTADVRDALRKALLEERDAKALEGVADVTGFRAFPPGTYEAALATVKTAGHSVEDVVVGGWARANEARRPLWSYGP